MINLSVKGICYLLGFEERRHWNRYQYIFLPLLLLGGIVAIDSGTSHKSEHLLFGGNVGQYAIETI